MISDDTILDDAERQIGEKAIVTIAKTPAHGLGSSGRSWVRSASPRTWSAWATIGKNTAKRVIAVAGFRHTAQACRGLDHLAELALVSVEGKSWTSTRPVSPEKGEQAFANADEEIDAIYTSPVSGNC